MCVHMVSVLCVRIRRLIIDILLVVHDSVNVAEAFQIGVSFSDVDMYDSTRKQVSRRNVA